MSLLASSVHVGFAVLVLLVAPYALVYERYFSVSRVVLLQALLATFALLAGLMPAAFPFWVPWALVLGLVFAVRRLREGHREPLFDPLRNVSVWVLWGLSFLLFLFRWDPPGPEAAWLGAAGRRVIDAGAWRWWDPAGAPSFLVALFHLGHWASLERLVSFFTALGLAAYAFTLASALGLWFDRRASWIGAALTLTALPLPQELLAQGAAGPLFALTAGWVLLEFMKSVLVRYPSHWEWIVYGLAIGFGFLCEPWLAGVSLLAVVPVLLWGLGYADDKAEYGRQLGTVVLIGLAVGFPSLWVSARQIHWGSSPWGGGEGAILSLMLGALTIRVSHRPKHLIPWLSLVTVIALAAFGAKVLGGAPWLHRALAGAAMLPLAVPLAWVAERALVPKGAVTQAGAVALMSVVVLFGAFRLYFHRGEDLAVAPMTREDLRAMEYIARFLPEKECIQVTSRFAGRWIPAIAGRCVVSGDGPLAPWGFRARGEGAGQPADTLFEGGAFVYRMPAQTTEPPPPVVPPEVLYPDK